ncbi:hypothetical protein CVT26_006998 [Gymnopilus dilepis]|uniref:Uncharacterized protein n=1 Tax=Gymnopilus dilepis TaxID=231916 RepID=A0A409W138_9AGAR|nr:hypothetical protein CVT26_006998 [Gymnopilus dilepis]
MKLFFLLWVFSTAYSLAFGSPAVLGIDYRSRLGGLDLITLLDGGSIVGNVTNDSLEESYAAQCAEVNSPTGQQAVQMDIRNLTASQNDVVEYSTIIRESIYTALSVLSYVTDFTSNVMPYIANKTDNGAIPLDDAVATLQGYIAIGAMGRAQNFMDFQNDLKAFAQSFQEFAQDVKSNDDTQVDSLENDIKSLNSTIQSSLDAEMAGVAKSMGSTLFSSLTIFDGFPLLGSLATLAGLFSLDGDTAKFDSLSSQRNGYQSQLDTDKSKIVAIEKTDATIADANEGISLVQELSSDTTFRLGSFDAIWAAVVSDCDQVIQYFEFATEIEIPLVLWGSLNNVACYYESMATSLQLYVEALCSTCLPEDGGMSKTLSGDELHKKMSDLKSRKEASKLVTLA